MTRGLVIGALLVGCSNAPPPPHSPAPAPTVEIAPDDRAQPDAGVTPTPSAEPAASVALEIELPKAAPGTFPDRVAAVALTKDGGISLDGSVLNDMAALVAEGRRIAADDPDLTVVIMADGEVTYARVIEAIDALKQAGLTKFAFAVSRP